jgi:hypothetical protein
MQQNENRIHTDNLRTLKIAIKLSSSIPEGRWEIR